MLSYDEHNVFHDFIKFDLIWENRELHSYPAVVWRMILDRNPDLKLWWVRLDDKDKIQLLSSISKEVLDG